MTEKHKNPTNVPILKKIHRVEHAQLAFENASKTHLFSSRLYQNKNSSSYLVAHAHDSFCVDERNLVPRARAHLRSAGSKCHGLWDNQKLDATF